MNKFSIFGINTDREQIFITSEKANIKLIEEVMKIVYPHAIYQIFEGHIKSVYDYDPVQLRQEVTNRLEFLMRTKPTSFPSTGSLQPTNSFYSERISKLREYIKVTET
jgi:hypothetical protein